MAQLLPPIPKEPIEPNSHVWREWFNSIRNVIVNTAQGVIAWASLNFAGSNIKDIVTRNHNDLQTIQGGTANQYYHLTATQLTNLGTVTTVSVATSNGFAGTVATATSTPAITLSTSVTGLLKGNGTAISAAVSSTDYAPATSGASILYGNGSGGFSNVTIGSGVSFTTGTLSATGSGGTVTSVTGTAPVVSSGGTAPAISMAAATTSVSGYLTSTDWTTFNNKQASGSYLTTVISDAPLTGSGTSGSHLSIPAATTSVSGYLTSTDWTTFNNKGSGTVTSVTGTAGRVSSTGGTTPVIDLVSGIASAGTTGSVSLIPVVTIDTYGRVTSITTAANPQGTVTSVAAITLGTTGTDLSSTVATGTTTPAITLQVPTASASNRGVLSAADWTTFNSKGSGTVTSVTGSAPVVSSGGTTPAISMAAATTSVSGYLTSTDWTTFNSKQPAGSYLVSGGALGTPSSGTATNLTGLPLTTGVTGNLPVTNLNSGTSASALTFWRGDGSWSTPAGAGTVTSVAQSFTGGLISVSGSPIMTSGTLALTVAGTGGGVPYFSSASTWATSAALAASALVIGGGAGAAPVTTTTGTGVVTALGVNTGTAGAFVVNGGALGTPSSGTVTNLTGTASININGTVGATTANTGAFTTISASGVFSAEAGGTAAAPSITFIGDTDTGIARVAANTFIGSSNGTEVFRVAPASFSMSGASTVTATNAVMTIGDATRTASTSVTTGAIVCGGGLGVWSDVYIGGLINISAAGAGQIKFPATQNASTDVNTLDDYEEGTWTPTGVGVIFSSASGKYTKIGRCVYIQFSATWPVTGAGNAAGIQSFPFVGEGSAYAFAVGKTTSATALNLSMPGYLGSLSGLSIYAAAGGAAILDSALSTNTISGSGFYFV